MNHCVRVARGWLVEALLGEAGVAKLFGVATGMVGVAETREGAAKLFGVAFRAAEAKLFGVAVGAAETGVETEEGQTK